MDNINDRIQKIIDTYFSGNKALFSRELGISTTAIEGIVGKRKSAPSFQVLQKICAIENISADWLVSGYGSMEKGLTSTNKVKECSASSMYQKMPPDESTTPKSYDRSLKERDLTIHTMNNYIETLKEQIQQKDAQIRDLMDLLKNG